MPRHLYIYGIILLLLGAATHLPGQNLVPNHDFSQLSRCLDRRDNRPYAVSGANLVPDSNHHVAMFQDWFAAPEPGYPSPANQEAGTYVAHHRNCSFAPVDTFFYTYNTNPCGAKIYSKYYPPPVEGSGYAGLILLDSLEIAPFYGCLQNSPCSSNANNCFQVRASTYYRAPYNTWVYYAWREPEHRRNFLQTRLQQPLQAGVNYTLEFSVIRKAHCFYSTGDIGAYLSTDTFRYRDYRQQTIQPQVSYSGDSVHNGFQNYQQWTHVKGSFTAQGGEEYLTLGNFKDYNLSASFGWHRVYWTPRDTPYSSYWYSRTPADYFFDAVYLYRSSDTLFSVQLPPDTTLCPGDSLTLYARHTSTFDIQASKSFHWSNGETDSSITIGQPGTYWVRVAYNNRWVQSDTIQVSYHPRYRSGLPPDTVLCAEGNLNLRAAPAPPGVALQWLNGPSGAVYTVDSVGAYVLRSITACDTLYDTVQVRAPLTYQAQLPADTSLCRGRSLLLQAATQPGLSHRWNTGVRGPRLRVDSAGTYVLRSIALCDTFYDTARVQYYPLRVPTPPSDTVMCRQDTLRLQVDRIPGASYYWSTGDTLPMARFYEIGPASVDIFTRCDTFDFSFQIRRGDCALPEVYVPNSFTPNGDGVNDLWKITNLNPAGSSLQIYNRWGERVYQAAPYRNNWRGYTQKGKKLPGGVYVYYLRYRRGGQLEEQQGWVQILR